MDSSKLVTPFVLGGVVTGEHFAGRATEIERLRAIAASGQDAYLFAPRRYGKTSLLREAFGKPQEAGSLVLLWCDCLPTTEPRSLAIRLAEVVVRAARLGRVGEWAKLAGSLFKRLRPVLKVGTDGSASIALDLAPHEPPLPDLEDALGAVGRLAEAKRKPLVLVLDEFQQIAEWDVEHRAEALIRTAIQHFDKVSCIFAGSERHLLQQMFSDRARPLFQLAAPFPLGRLTAPELRPWLEERFAAGGLKADGGALDAIITLAAGHPGATQFLCHFVWEAAVAKGVSAVTLDVMRDGLGHALEASDTIYAAEYSRLTLAQRVVLAAVAMEPTASPTAAAYLARHKLPSKSTVSQSLGSLLEKGHIEQEPDVYVISDPLMGEWIRKLHGS